MFGRFKVDVAEFWSILGYFEDHLGMIWAYAEWVHGMSPLGKIDLYIFFKKSIFEIGAPCAACNDEFGGLLRIQN